MVVPAIVGPTASGKTPLSLILAERLHGEIVSADSRQVYKYLDVGTAKPAKGDLLRVPHHFIDILDPRQDYSAGQYGKEAREVIEQILDRRRVPMIVGGSGLYVRSVIEGLFEGPAADPEIRARLEEELKEAGLQSLLERLRKCDVVSYEAMKDEPKARRIMRALEIFHRTGKPLSALHKEHVEPLPFQAVQLALNWPTEKLYRKINDRVDAMLRAGFREEVESLLARGYERSLNSLNTVGYKEIVEHLDGKRSFSETSDLIKRNTRRFAKRQLTWFRHDKRIRWLQPSEDFELLAVVVQRELRGREAGD